MKLESFRELMNESKKTFKVGDRVYIYDYDRLEGLGLDDQPVATFRAGKLVTIDGINRNGSYFVNDKNVGMISFDDNEIDFRKTKKLNDSFDRNFRESELDNILIGDIFFNGYYQCAGEVIDLDTIDEVVTVEWDNKKAGTKEYNFDELKKFTTYSVRK